jgi:hypothetical protein
VGYVKHNKLDITIKKFLELDAYTQRNMLINLLIYNKDDEIQYICYLLYDLITATSAESSENNDQTIIYESLPWRIKKYFKDVVKYTVKYTNDMIQKYDIHRITLEQQIYLLKAGDVVKEKAMAKLKEIKGKPDESGTKAKQYLEGLVKIPFGIYREEPILKKMKELNRWFIRTTLIINQLFPEINLPKKEKYSNMEIIAIINKTNEFFKTNICNLIENNIENHTNKQIIPVIHHINSIKKTKKEKKFPITNTTKQENTQKVLAFLKENNENETMVTDVFDLVNISSPLSLAKTKDQLQMLSSSSSSKVKTNLTITIIIIIIVINYY